jgi:hypothetical protein
MVLDIKKFSGLDALTTYVKGRLRGSTDLTKTPGSLYLHGLTLIFTTPVASVTFAATPAAAQVPLTVAQVKTQIETQTAAAVLVNFVNGRLELRAAPAGALVLAANGTSNPLLGFDATTASSVAPVNPAAGASPKFVALQPEGNGTYILVTDV